MSNRINVYELSMKSYLCILQLKEHGRENTLVRLFATVKLIHNYSVEKWQKQKR